ncbi:MAG TPA: (2Fe-2S) ferredoxin domain-containing protein [Dongiaceae bacterium]|jgi:(2Fe-2S) ferredoxin|nr:(2Fe-2S) ferredoxin domain-containing protein [Dongiaceae bacterium]
MTVPYFKRHVFCCVNQRPEGHPRGCCKAKGSESWSDYMKARAKELGLEDTRINRSLCLDRCEHGPVIVVYPEGVWYHCGSREDAEEIVSRHLLGGEIVTRLLLPERTTI